MNLCRAPMVTYLLKPVLVHFTKRDKLIVNKIITHKLYCLFNPVNSLSTSTIKNNFSTLENEENIEQNILSYKEQIISKLSFRCMEDAQPFYKLPIKTLVHVYKVCKNDEKEGHCKNRLYYISNKLKCPPSVLSKHVAQRTFIYSLSFDWLQKSLNVLLEMGVSSERLLRDLWVLKYNANTIRERLQKVKNMGVENIYPWMVRCSEDILNRYVEIMQETKDILGETKSTQIYLANRLNTTLEAVNEMCIKTPALKTIRVTKVKHFLDFLISEGFTVEDVASKPRILAASQKTIKKRIDTLRELGVQEININLLCRSKKHFNKFCESIESVKKIE
ncbi:transcription termination factor, mitochondrial [Ostrinia furnacalis]|uniref:transcription termination factor, mitochondrial n=1 Tax=Ostrinia furnacalis TaxID=93504 RepID=UPI00104068F9|nr:transcription termination factor, mitochondrial [Ostrinia furnacalis]